MRVLLVEDDESLGAVTKRGLELKGYVVDWVKDGVSASQVLKNELFDVIILDLGLPRLPGYDLLRIIRGRGTNTPVLILTANDVTNGCIKGLDLGADDYMTKPFDLDELSARLRALHRRGAAKMASIIRYGEIALDPAAHTVTYRGELLDLPRREFMLLQKLLENPGKVLSREYLAQMLYGWAENADSNTIEVFVHHLRKKFGQDFIHTIRGVGYMIAAEESDQTEVSVQHEAVN